MCVCVCTRRLDTYVERARLSPDGLLTQDDVDDLCHELEEPGLQHPLTELRNRCVCVCVCVCVCPTRVCVLDGV